VPISTKSRTSIARIARISQRANREEGLDLRVGDSPQADCYERVRRTVLYPHFEHSIGCPFNHDTRKRLPLSAIWHRSHRERSLHERPTKPPRDASNQSLQSGLDAMTTCWTDQVIFAFLYLLITLVKRDIEECLNMIDEYNKS